MSLPGMVSAVVLHPPRFGATVASVDDRAALAEPGVIAVVPIEEGVAVVGETAADAQHGLHALNVEWDDTAAGRRSSSEMLAEHVRLLDSGEKAVVSRDDGDVEPALASAEATIDAVYTPRIWLTPRWSPTTPRVGCARTPPSRFGRAPSLVSHWASGDAKSVRRR